MERKQKAFLKRPVWAFKNSKIRRQNWRKNVQTYISHYTDKIFERNLKKSFEKSLEDIARDFRISYRRY